MPTRDRLFPKIKACDSSSGVKNICTRLWKKPYASNGSKLTQTPPPSSAQTIPRTHAYTGVRANANTHTHTHRQKHKHSNTSRFVGARTHSKTGKFIRTHTNIHTHLLPITGTRWPALRGKQEFRAAVRSRARDAF